MRWITIIVLLSHQKPPAPVSCPGRCGGTVGGHIKGPRLILIITIPINCRIDNGVPLNEESEGMGQSDDGLYEAIVRVKIPKINLKSPSAINCVLTIPGTNYTKKQETIFYGKAFSWCCYCCCFCGSVKKRWDINILGMPPALFARHSFPVVVSYSLYLSYSAPSRSAQIRHYNRYSIFATHVQGSVTSGWCGH